MNEGKFTCYTSCFKCKKQIEVEFDDDNFETEENVTFLGRQGTMKYHYSPYCGAKESGFRPYDPDQKMDLSLEDDPVKLDEEEQDDGEAWWPDVEGVTLIDEDEEDDDDSCDESEKSAFACPSCGKKTWLNPKGCEKIFCYYCGKEAMKKAQHDKSLHDLTGKMGVFQNEKNRIEEGVFLSDKRL